MKIIKIKSYKDIKPFKENFNLILGNFDGVHIGHTNLITFARNNSKNKLGVLTFSKSLKRDGDYLTSLDDKIEFFEDLGVDFVILIEYSESIKMTTYEEFIDLYLRKLNANKIFCGPDFKFGYKGLGDIDALKNAFPNLCVINFVLDHNGDKIASTTIRKQIQDGDIINANRHLGHKYKIKGQVIKGKGIGKTLGFPTCNIKLDFNYIIPKNGVYITYIKIDNKIHESITNVGVSPTIKNDNIITIETYIFDFCSDIYNKKVSLFFIDRLRDEIKFDSKRKLINQLEDDLKKSYKYFENLKIY